MNEIESFKNTIEQFLSDHRITATRFGRDYAGDPLFVFQLRAGREPRTETRERILKAMQPEPTA